MPFTLHLVDDLQLRLVQWLLDQLNSRKELETLTQQISVLVSQAQEQSLEDLYSYIGILVFQKATQFPPGGSESRTPLLAELCYSLSVAHFKQRISLSPRILLIHEHVLRLCMDSISAENALEPASATSPPTGNEISVEIGSEVLANLWNFQLISIVQICEYIFRVIEAHKRSVGPKLADAVAGVHFLLDSCFHNRSCGHWDTEVSLFHEWVDSCSSFSGNEINTVGVGGVDQRNEINAASKGEHTVTRHISHSASSTDDGGALSKSTNDPIPSNKISNLLQSQANEEETAENAMRNNYGRPPQSPPTLHSKGLEDVRSGVLIDTAAEHRLDSIVFTSETALEGAHDQTASDIQVATSAPTPSNSANMTSGAISASPTTATTSSGTTSGGQRPAGSPRMNANMPPQHQPPYPTVHLYQHQHPMVHPHQRHPGYPMPPPPPPHWGPAGYHYPPPHNYNPHMHWGMPQRQHPHMPQIHQSQMQPPLRTQPAQPRPSSTPSPVPNDASPRPPPKVTTSTPPKRPSTIVLLETEQQKNQRLAKEKEERMKAAKEKTENEQKGNENIEEEKRSKEEAERKVKEQEERTAQVEAERKAKATRARKPRRKARGGGE
ncbi:hypothetical protein B0J17DRAFT_722520 [Rhizoctonia solani]|nr:hypothetical protein B0J17DRAFT_722520 [Rhizoctonia solani]